MGEVSIVLLFVSTNNFQCQHSNKSTALTSRPNGFHNHKHAWPSRMRGKAEALAHLLTRLDLAIGRAKTEDVFTDEVNHAGFHRP